MITCIPCIFLETGVMWLRLRHGVKVKEGLAPDETGYSRIMQPVKSLEELQGDFFLSHLILSGYYMYIPLMLTL